ncbi:hypothetical protein NL676_025116 [Syzygium grande]|nr:hypothetical protein NL676_025116 [Syzygium grande]
MPTTKDFRASCHDAAEHRRHASNSRRHQPPLPTLTHPTPLCLPHRAEVATHRYGDHDLQIWGRSPSATRDLWSLEARPIDATGGAQRLLILPFQSHRERTHWHERFNPCWYPPKMVRPTVTQGRPPARLRRWDCGLQFV